MECHMYAVCCTLAKGWERGTRKNSNRKPASIRNWIEQSKGGRERVGGFSTSQIIELGQRSLISDFFDLFATRTRRMRYGKTSEDKAAGSKRSNAYICMYLCRREISKVSWKKMVRIVSKKYSARPWRWLAQKAGKKWPLCKDMSWDSG